MTPVARHSVRHAVIAFTLCYGAAARVMAACPANLVVAAEKSVGEAGQSWASLYQHFRRYTGCDDGSVAEGYSEAVVGLLADSWATLPQLQKLIRDDASFGKFVVRHVDDVAGGPLLRKARKNARTACPDGLQSLCKQVREAADRVLSRGLRGPD